MIQSVILIDLAYLWGISWANKYTDGNRTCGLCLIIFSVAFFFIIIICLINYFSENFSTLIGVIGIV